MSAATRYNKSVSDETLARDDGVGSSGPMAAATYKSALGGQLCRTRAAATTTTSFIDYQ